MRVFVRQIERLNSRRVIRWLFAGMLVSVLAAACDYVLSPLRENEFGPFSMYGYLDLNADTQWVRVTRIRTGLLSISDPIDAVVTMEHVESGRIVTLTDSLRVFRDDRLGSTSYAHNFWTTEPVAPGATYRLKVLSADGDSTTAVVDMPERADLVFRNRPPFPDTIVALRGELFHVDVLYLMENVCGGTFDLQPIPQAGRLSASVAPVRVVTPPEIECLQDLERHELRVVIVPPGWPLRADLSEPEVSVPGKGPSNVVNGLGYVGGLATWQIPFPLCEVIVPRPDQIRTCEFEYDSRSASIEGRVVRCDDPQRLSPIRLIEEFPNGGTIVRSWSTGVDGEYRFDAIEPGARLTLELTIGTPVARPPALAAGQRYEVPDINVPGDC